jgi:hypothetical protein
MKFHGPVMGPLTASTDAKTAFGSHPCRGFFNQLRANCSLSRHFQEFLGI